jgi:pseudouridine synthase
MERLQKILAARGVASRREAESLIVSGRVRVNGQIVRELGTKADPDSDRIEFDGRVLPVRLATRVLMLHKPVGYLTTCRRSREIGREILELVPNDRRYFPVGRLDRDSSGLILLTDDGDLAFRLTHPSRHVPKVYIVDVKYPLSRSALSWLTRGFELEDGMARVDDVEPLSEYCYRITLHEGRKRQIRRMIAMLNSRVLALHRVKIGDLELNDLPVGHWRELSPQEIQKFLPH